VCSRFSSGFITNVETLLGLLDDERHVHILTENLEEEMGRYNEGTLQECEALGILHPHRYWHGPGKIMLWPRFSVPPPWTMEAVGQEDLFMCVGMETLLTPEISRVVNKRKRRHVRSVLLVQVRQSFKGPVNVREITAISERSSEWTHQRSQKLATGYWNLLKDDELTSAPSALQL